MRTVAVACTLMFVLTLVPLVEAEDECQTNAAAAQACVPVEARPTTQPPAPGVPPTPYWGKYYVWLSPARCASPLSYDCRGQTGAPGAGVPLPEGGALGVNVFGVLWQESNGLPGLQRSQITGGGRLPDHMVLV